MNNRILIQTLSQMPDLLLLQELQRNLHNSNINVPDLNKLFRMFSFLLKNMDKKIVFTATTLVIDIVKTLLMTEVQICWREVGRSVMVMLGAEDIELRRKGEQMVLFFLDLSKNGLMILQTIYHEERSLKRKQSRYSELYEHSSQNILKLQQYLIEKVKYTSFHLCIAVAKLILQKLIRLTSKDNANLSKCAKEFLHSLFFANVINLNEVLQRMDSFYLKSLQKIWQKEKEELLYKNSGQEEKIKVIQYEHLPMIKDKFFGIYQPFVIKNLFSSQTIAGRKYAAQEFHRLFVQNQEQLSKFINLITKIIIRALPNMDIQIIQLLHHILNVTGISNIINFTPLLHILIQQLSNQSVPYRKLVRQCLERLNSIYQHTLNAYNQTINALHKDNNTQDWILVYQLFLLLNHWTQIKEPADCFPPVLNEALLFAFHNKSNKIPKVKEKCGEFLFYVLQKYPSYRQTLQDCLSGQQMGLLEDQIQERKNFKRLNEMDKKQAKQTFKQYYQQERMRYINKK